MANIGTPSNPIIVQGARFVSPLISKLQQQMAFLSSVKFPWFDDNPYPWEAAFELQADGLPAGYKSPWDQLFIDGIEFTGHIKGHVATKLDVKEYIKNQGAVLTQLGLRASKGNAFDVTIYLLTPSSMIRYATMIERVFQALNSKVTLAQKAVPIQHPSLSLYQTTNFYLFDIGEIQPPKDGMFGMVELKFMLFLTPINGNSNGSVSTVGQTLNNPSFNSGNTPPSPPTAPNGSG